MKKLFFTMLLFSYILIYLIRTPGQSPAVSDQVATVKIHVTEAPARFFDEGRPVDVTGYPAETAPTSAVTLPEIPSPTPTTAPTSTPVPTLAITEGTAGAMVIPSINLSKPLTWCCSRETQKGVDSGATIWAEFSGCYFIAGHKHNGMTPLYDTAVGDEVYIYKNGVKTVYTITGVYFFNDRGPNPIKTTTLNYLYIQTCQLSGYPNVCVVVAEDLTPKPSPTPTPTPTLEEAIQHEREGCRYWGDTLEEEEKHIRFLFETGYFDKYM